MLDFKPEILTHGTEKKGLKIVSIDGRAIRNGGVKEPGTSVIDTSEKLPIPFEAWMKNVVERLAWIAF